MKEKILIVLILCSIALPVKAIQTSFSDGSSTGYYQSDKTTKVYDKDGSYQYKLVQKSNGQTREYGKTGSFQGYYKQQGSKLKYYPSKN